MQTECMSSSCVLQSVYTTIFNTQNMDKWTGVWAYEHKY